MTIDSNGSGPPTWTFGPSPLVDPDGTVHFENISGKVDVTMVLAGSAGATWNAADADDALLTYDPGDNDPGCASKGSASGDAHWQFGAPSFPDSAHMTFEYKNKNLSKTNKPMKCNLYGLGVIINGTAVSHDPVIHNSLN